MNWTRRDYLLIASLVVAVGLVAAVSTLLPGEKLPSCFDPVAKANAQPGDKCNPVH